MEKTTKKKKKTKSLRRRIGIIAVGGLSLVMTICLSVGATLAWFAGSTWSDENLYMGGPVYVEMAGRGASGATNGDGKDVAKWQGGTGSLDIQASAARSSGTAYSTSGEGADKKYYDAMGNELSAAAAANIDRNVLLPGQKFEIYSQARVYSTATTSTIADSDTASNSSGANVTNKSGTGMAYHRSNNGRITTTTTSVLRARFSISVEFDPSVGFGNFTNASYMLNYPVQSSQYKGDGIGGTWTPDTNFEDGKDDSSYVGGTPLDWDDALTDTPFTVLNKTDGTTTFTGRRDAVKATVSSEDLAKGVKPFTSTQEAPDVFDTAQGADNSALTSESSNDLLAIQKGNKKSIYSWKYVSEATYKSTEENGSAAPLTVENISDIADLDENTTVKYVQMGYPFDGHDTSTNSNGYYGVWILNDDKTGVAESDAFYKARCNAYLQTYVEEFESEYGNIEKKTIADSLLSLESALNQSFVNLVNDSSDDIHAGFTKGFTVDQTTGQMVPTNASPVEADMHDASWLYIDPSIGNDTNTNEISTSTGGWWYLVADDGAVGGVATGTSEVTAITDSVEYNSTTGKWVNAGTETEATSNDPDTAGTNFKRLLGSNGGITATDPQRLTAKLYEIKPNAQELEIVGMNNTTGVKKIVSPAFPFVNGSSALPGDALTNVFANAKISFQISFQALQAFFPFSTSIDKIDYKNPLLGTAKALNIKNAIPIFNEAFDYQETGITSSTISGL